MIDFEDDEIIQLFKSLHMHRVQYILVGGFAVNLHGYSRLTADVDIWLKDTVENRIKLRKALFDIQLGDILSLETVQFIPGFTTLYLNSGFEIDFMSYLFGLSQDDFDEHFTQSSTIQIGDSEIRFIHLNALIKSKENSHRLKDQLDAIELKKVRDFKK